MEDSKSQFPAARGGSPLCPLSASCFFLCGGANRQQQLSDFWKVQISSSSPKCERLNVADPDSFQSRNSHAAVPYKGKVLVFGGKDSENDAEFNDLFVFCPESNSLKEIHFDEGDVVPPKRNSHAMVKVSEGTFCLFGGANNDSGPLSDCYLLDITETEDGSLKAKFRVVKLAGSIPALEMHSMEKVGEKVLVIGGRSFDFEKGAYFFSNNIYAIDLQSESVSEFAQLPSELFGHSSCVVGGEKYLLLYGGTNGLRFFDTLIRYDLQKKTILMMVKMPENLEGAQIFKHGRISTSMVITKYESNEEHVVIFGGSSAEEDHCDFTQISVAHVLEDKHFCEINEIF